MNESPAQLLAFNRLERAVLDWCAQRYGDAPLKRQLESACLVQRKCTGVGFHIQLKVALELPAVDMATFGRKWPLDGPTIESPDIEDGGGSLIWGKDGHVTGIELFAYGDYFAEDVEAFTLLDPPQQTVV